MDGFTLDMAEDGVFLTVAPDCQASAGNVISALKERGVVDYYGDAIKTALENRQGTPERVAEPCKAEDKEADSGHVKIITNGGKVNPHASTSPAASPSQFL